MEIAVIILLIVCAALMVICYIECVIADRAIRRAYRIQNECMKYIRFLEKQKGGKQNGDV